MWDTGGYLPQLVMQNAQGALTLRQSTKNKWNATSNTFEGSCVGDFLPDARFCPKTSDYARRLVAAGQEIED